MDIIELPLQERIKLGRSHVARINWLDLNSAAALTRTLQLFPYVARDEIGGGLFDLVTPFVGAGITSLTLQVGFNNTTLTDVPNAFLEASEVLAAGRLLAGNGAIAGNAVDAAFDANEQAVLASLRTRANRLAAQESGNVEALFTAIGANLTALTAGEVLVYFNVIRLPSFRGING